MLAAAAKRRFALRSITAPTVFIMRPTCPARHSLSLRYYSIPCGCGLHLFGALHIPVAHISSGGSGTDHPHSFSPKGTMVTDHDNDCKEMDNTPINRTSTMSITIRSPVNRARTHPEAVDSAGDKDNSVGNCIPEGDGGASTSSSIVSAHRRLSSPHSPPRFAEPIKRIILLRNGRSLTNEDVSSYVTTPDWRIPLVDEGKRECIQSGRELAELVGDEPVYFYYSPYIRSRQSLRYVLQGYDIGVQEARNNKAWWETEDAESDLVDRAVPASGDSSTSTASPLQKSRPDESCAGKMNEVQDTSLVLRSGSSNRVIGVREDVRLRDGDIGRYGSTKELLHHLDERERYGHFFYRFPHGESGADVCDRVTSFLDAFQRERVDFPMDTNVVIITHGLTLRMFIKRWFHLSVDTFHKMRSPPSGSLCTLTRLHHRSCFRLDDSCVEAMCLPLSLNEYNGYKYRNKQLLGSMSCGAPYM